MSVEALLQKVIEDVRNAIERGCTVIIDGINVKKIDLVKSKHGYIVVINDTETRYASKFLTYRRVILCHGDENEKQQQQ